jgi:hypothetical protein
MRKAYLTFTNKVAGLHNGDYRPKLVPFEAHKNIFYF